MKTVQRALDLLLLLKHFEELPLKKISASLGTRSNSVWNLLHYLRESGYVEKKKNGVYRLGPEFYVLAGNSNAEGVRGTLEKTIYDLANTVKESAVSVKLEGNHLKILHHVEYKREIMVSNRIYERDDALYCWASGHVLLAWQSKSILEGVIASNGLPQKTEWPGTQTKKGLSEELDKIRETGFAERLAEKSNIYSIAIPVLVKGKIKMAVGVNYPGFRNTDIHRQAILGNLKKATNILSEKYSKS